MLYLYFADGLDQFKITSSRFMERLHKFALDEWKVAQFKQSFAILDIDRDGKLNLQNLLHIYMSVDKKSPFGREIFKLIYYLMDKNIYNKKDQHYVDINYEAFLKVTDSKSVLRDEMRRNFLGIEVSVKHMVESNLLKQNEGGGESEQEFEEYKPSQKNKAFGKPHPTKSVFEPLPDEVIAQRNEEEKETTNYELADVIFR